MTCKDCIWFYQEKFDDGYTLPPECLCPDVPSWISVSCSHDNPTCCWFYDMIHFKEVSK